MRYPVQVEPGRDEANARHVVIDGILWDVMTWYLTSINFGAEINETVPAAGFDVAHYSLTGVR